MHGEELHAISETVLGRTCHVPPLGGLAVDCPRVQGEDPASVAKLPSSPKASRSSFFSIDPEFQREASPSTHVAKGNRYPPFLIFHVGTRADSRGQSEALAERLRQAGGKATTVHEPDKTHMTINRELGSAGDGQSAGVPRGSVSESRMPAVRTR